jgi:hypothetical protein
MTSRVLRVAVGVAAVVQTGGCFAYRPSDIGAVRSGELVRVAITPRGAEQLTEQVGPRVETLGGRVLRPRDTTLVVSVRELTRSRGAEEFWTGDSVSVSFSGVDAVSVRRFDRNRTFLAVAGAAIGIVLLRGAMEESGILGGRVNRQPGSQ